MGRPSKLTRERQELIVQALRTGCHREPALRAAGVGESTFYEWLQRGAADGSGPYWEFLEAVRRAEAECELYAVAILRQAMLSDWRAAVSYLERRHPSRWRRPAIPKRRP